MALVIGIKLTSFIDKLDKFGTKEICRMKIKSTLNTWDEKDFFTKMLYIS